HAPPLYPLSLHDALPIYRLEKRRRDVQSIPDLHVPRRLFVWHRRAARRGRGDTPLPGSPHWKADVDRDRLRNGDVDFGRRETDEDRKSTRLNSIHVSISY